MMQRAPTSFAKESTLFYYDKYNKLLHFCELVIVHI